jgi:hypothetical protein
METLKIDKAKATKLYKEVPEWFRQELCEIFGNAIKGTIIDRIKTFEDACNEMGINPDELTSSFDTRDERAYKKLKVIIKVINEGWEPNWNDSKEYKWFPWFKWSSGSGFAFSGSLCSCANTLTGVGSRLCFPSEELANYFGKQFIEIHNELLIIKK